MLWEWVKGEEKQDKWRMNGAEKAEYNDSMPFSMVYFLQT
jgi:hypothetical protein